MNQSRKALPLILFICGIMIHTEVFAQSFEWAKHVGGDTSFTTVNNIFTDAANDVYVSGEFTGTIDFDPGPGVANLSPLGVHGIYIAKYSSNGNYIWSRAIAGFPNGFGGAYSNHLDEYGNIYVTGTSPYEGCYIKTNTGVDTVQRDNGFFIKYDRDGNYQMAKHLFPQDNLYSRCFIFAITTDVKGDIYLTGSFKDTVDFDPGPNTHYEYSPYNQNDIFLAKYDAEGNFGWVKTMPRTDTASSLNRAFHMIRDRSGNLYLSGDFSATTDFDPGPGTALITPTSNPSFLAKYDSAGNYLWAINTGGSKGSNNLVEDTFGNIYMAGILFSPMDMDPGPGVAMLTPQGGPDMYLAKIDAQGNYLWSKILAGALGAAVGPNGFVISQSSTLYLTGFYSGVLSFDPCVNSPLHYSDQWGWFVAQYDGSGNYLWAGTAEGDISARSGAEGMGLALGANGNLYSAGRFWGTVDVDLTPGNFPITAIARKDSACDMSMLQLNFHDTTLLPPYHYVDIAVCTDNLIFNHKKYTRSGQYTETFPLSKGCGDSTIVLNLIFSKIAEPSIYVDDQKMLSVKGLYAGYQWLKNGNIIPGAKDPTYLLHDNGAYQVVVTNEYGCSDTSVVYKVTNYYTGMEHVAEARDALYVYPNPTTGILHIAAPGPVDVKLTDACGRIITEYSSTQTISLNHVATGMYLLNIYDQSGPLLRTVKIVKQ